MRQYYVGAYLAIPAGNAMLLAKVIFASSYFADVIALKLFAGSNADDPLDVEATDQRPFELHYTSMKLIRSKRWAVVGQGPVSAAERALTRRTAGGELWLEDVHLGPASDADLETLPRMLVAGSALIEKHAARLAAWRADLT